MKRPSRVPEWRELSLAFVYGIHFLAWDSVLKWICLHFVFCLCICGFCFEMNSLSLSLFGVLRQGFSLVLQPVLELALVGQAGLELKEIHLPLRPKCWDKGVHTHCLREVNS